MNLAQGSNLSVIDDYLLKYLYNLFIDNNLKETIDSLPSDIACCGVG